MLVLTRRKSEQLVITLGDQTVLVRVLDVGRDRVRLGIVAPKEVAVHREEVARRIADEEARDSYLADVVAVPRLQILSANRESAVR
jgi:carbon storage regulator